MASPGWVIVNGVFRFGSPTQASDGTAALPSIAFSRAPTSGFFLGNGTVPSWSYNATEYGSFYVDLIMRSTSGLSWASGAPSSTSQDTYIKRIAAGVPGNGAVGGGSQTGGFPASIFTSTAVVNNGTTVETDLVSYTLPASSLSVNGQKLRITAVGTYTNNTNTKTAKLYFGSTVLSSISTATLTVTGWQISAVLARTGATTQIATGTTWAGNTGAGSTGTQLIVASPAETLANAITVKVTGQSSAASNDVATSLVFVEWIP